MRQERAQRTQQRTDDEPADITAAGRERREQLDDGTESLLDEIDDVLEENAAEFVRSYVQKGGQ
ncbi:ubiquitin-like protein Pup [Saccharopolyspora sp. TS4A08]|uniref:Prokaryotic ubiquitin-like protein Pup n=1 Tax=Saccharopolyspora ipomoeae TaxID=3042027 RepID=A0ABT6PQI4_9PSEU|nr:ubiquitin-like protein Pup [Saccharopolyspora sp. TS4A08]MDI2030252.1 ubiquitin-like protein Pup [Saccharopolyspora sp. TS4A08]